MDISALLKSQDPTNSIQSMTDDELKELLTSFADEIEKDKIQNQLMYYEPVSEKARKVHLSTAHNISAFGGKGSSKTDTMLVELIIKATGIIPDCLKDDYPKEKLKPGGRYRVIIESQKATLHPVILPKLKYWNWDGDNPESGLGHWGWIPKSMLIQGSWDKSWSEKLSMLTLANGSTIQFMSYDNNPEDFASGSFHAILHDEPPRYSIYRESVARVGRANGVLYLSMTPPDEAGINVGWIFDDIYEPGVETSSKHNPDFLSVEMFALENKFVNQEQVMARAMQLPIEKRDVYLYGRFLHLSNLIHPSFTDEPHYWCFDCKKRYPLHHGRECLYCAGDDVSRFCHVEDFEFKPEWPVIQIIDPHPRKPHMMQWVAINPHDEWHHVEIAKVDGELREVKEKCDEIEYKYGMTVARRIMDPNMGKQASTGNRRHVSWQEDFAEAGLLCDLGDDNFEVGRSRINEMLFPDSRTRFPRMVWHPRCADAIRQYKRYVFDEHARYSDKENKQTPRPSEDDFPTMDRYLLNADLDYSALKYIDRIWSRESARGRNVATGY
jgi:hypothetical protein